MLDIKVLVANKDYFIENLNKRSGDYSKIVNEACDNYRIYLDKLKVVEENKALLNKKSKEIGLYKREGKDVSGLLKEIESLKLLISDDNLKEYYNNYINALMYIPNILKDDTPFGKDEEDNVEIRKVGTIPNFDFEPKAHYEVGDDTNSFDLERASKISKSRFVISKNLIAKLERAISNYMLDTHTKSGYEEYSVPVIVSDSSLKASGQLPKFQNDLFKIERPSDKTDEFIENMRDFYLIPTAEVVLANLHRDEIIDASKLPFNYCAYSQCFRKEAGSAGRDTKGIIRVHQFGKVELFKYTLPSVSMNELEKMVLDAERILQGLELPYRVIRLCSGDIGFSASITYDIEVWFPSQNKYRECSSCSNVTDYQARRAMIRYSNEEGKKEYVHMLNGSGMATGRILAAVLENYQNEDGTIRIPKVLEKYLDM